MSTITDTPPVSNDNTPGTGMVIGVILAIILIALFIIYGLPAMRSNQGLPQQQPNTTNIVGTSTATNSTTTNTAPTTNSTTTTTQVNY
jgi:multisubunit Na+/H+ antiporter MnhB subunit